MAHVTRPRLGPGVGGVSLALMLAELVLTRIFSVTIWYHFAFVAIAVALLGVGLGGLVVHLARARLSRDRLSPAAASAWLARGCAALGLSLVLVDLALIHVPPDWFAGALGLFTTITARLVAVFALTSLPFFLGGCVIALAILHRPVRVARIYAWDLAGAGVGCLLTIPTLAWLGGPRALVFAGVLACLAGVWFAWLARRRRLLLSTLALALALTGALVRSGPGAGSSAPGDGLLELRVAKGLDLQNPFLRPEWSRWNAHSHVAVLPPHGFRGWGMSPRFRGRIPEQKTLVIDMNAMTTLTRFDGDTASAGLGHTWFDLSSFAYRLRPRAGGVCVVGAGGGKDVLGALASGARHVWAVELNPLIVDGVMRGAYREFTGGLYERDDVTVVIEDGRGFLHRTDERFDIVQLSMVDTSAATAAGAYALTENGLYTREAAGEYLARLRPEGLLSMASMSVPGLAVGARLTAVVRAALEDRQAVDPRVAPARASVVVLRAERMYNVLVKRGPFSEVELKRVEVQAEQLGFTAVYIPGRAPADDREARWIHTILTTADADALAREMATWPLDLSAPSDDRPFFFYQDRVRGPGDVVFALIGSPRRLAAPALEGGPGAQLEGHLLGGGLTTLARVGAALLLLVLLFVLTPLLAAARRRGSAGAERRSWDAVEALHDVVYVLALGLGFMFIELVLLQRLGLYLSDPTLTLAVVLAVLLLGGGLGSRILADGVVSRGARGAGGGGLARTVAVAAVGATLLFLVAVLQSDALVWLLEATRTARTGARAVIAAVAVAPLAVVLGTCLPAGLRVVAARAPDRVPWLWAVNAAASVLGAVLATVVIIHAGMTAAGWFAVICYALAFVFVPQRA